MTAGDEGRGERKRGRKGRPERLEAELKGNLKKRKERARALSGAKAETPSPPAGDKPER